MARAQPNNQLARLLAETKQLVKDQKAVDRRIAALNKRVEKADPRKDGAVAKKLQAAGEELNDLNQKAIALDASRADPWQYVQDTLSEIVRLQGSGGTDDSARAAALQEGLGLGRRSVSPLTITDWEDLRFYSDDGVLNSSRQEQHVAQLQMQFEQVFAKLDIEAPFPDADPEAEYW